jgi:hypothetical protein
VAVVSSRTLASCVGHHGSFHRYRPPPVPAHRTETREMSTELRLFGWARTRSN